MSSYRKAKTAPKIFEVNPAKLRQIVSETMDKIAMAVGSSMGPGGKNTLIESSFPGIPNKNTKDGVTIFKNLGAQNPYEHLIIEQARDVAIRTASEAGDGTTTATVLSNAIIQNLFKFCAANRKYSPQKAARQISKYTREVLIPYVRSRSISVTEDNQELLQMVAKISANGDEDMANAVIKAFEEIGYGEASHVTIREKNGPEGYEVERIDGFPLPVGFEDALGKMGNHFINDTANQRVVLEKPLFLLFDGQLNDIVSIIPITEELSNRYCIQGDSDYKNLVIVANGFSESVVMALANNWADPTTINVLPVVSPMAQFAHSQTHAIHDIAAFVGSKVFGLKNQISGGWTIQDLGGKMESFEAYRFRSTIVGDPEPMNVEVRAEDLKTQKKSAESQAEQMWLEERIGKITNGIAKLTVVGGSIGELKEKVDRLDDAICSVRAAISHGALPGGCRIAIDMALKIAAEIEPGNPIREVMVESLLALPQKLLDNSGFYSDEISKVLEHLVNNPNDVFDVENERFGDAKELGLFDATKAVEQSLNNAVALASVLGTMGGIICQPRDGDFERSEARADSEFTRMAENPDAFVNEANQRP